jgi:signal transduction histidine kinase
MKSFRLSTRITIWSAVVVTVAILLCGTIGTLYVLRTERNELDQQLHDEAKHFFGGLRNQPGQFDWVKDAGEVSEWISASTPPRIVAVKTEHGHTLYRSKTWPADFNPTFSSGPRSVTLDNASWRVGVYHRDGIVLYLGGSLEAVNDLAEELATTFLFTLPIVLAFVVFGGRLIAQKALAPIKQITAVAEHITARDLGERIPLPEAHDEIHRLGTVLNATFDRLEKSFQQATRFSADASHELKTPLTVLRASVESMLASTTHDLEIQQGLAGLLEETQRLSAITESLLLLARADAGKLRLDLQPGDLTETIRLCAGDAAILFEAEHIRMELELPSSAPAQIDRTRFSQVLMNLFDNARKYNFENGRVRISLTGNDATWEIRVANTGPGIHRDDEPRLFTRFFRGEHSSEKSGQGLGLSLSRELARAHGGDLAVVDSEAGWTTFLFTLPRTASPEHRDPLPALDIAHAPLSVAGRSGDLAAS